MPIGLVYTLINAHWIGIYTLINAHWIGIYTLINAHWEGIYTLINAQSTDMLLFYYVQQLLYSY